MEEKIGMVGREFTADYLFWFNNRIGFVLWNSPPEERSKLVADGEWDARRKLIPRPVQLWLRKPTGSRVSPAGVLPAERTKQVGSRAGSGTREGSSFPARFSYGCENRRGVGCPRQGYSPPKTPALDAYPQKMYNTLQEVT